MSATASPVEFCRRLTRVNIAYTIARMKVIEARSGRPVAVRRFGDAAALMAPQVPSPHFNAVVGLRGGQEKLIGELDDWYRANDIAGRFVIAPGDLSVELGRALGARGYAQTDFDTVLYAAPPPAVAHDPEKAWPRLDRGWIPVFGKDHAPNKDTPFEIVEVDSPGVMDEFLDALLSGWGIPHQHRAGAKQNMAGWLGVPEFRLYLVRIDGRPAAAAKLFLHDGVGYFPDAATDPDFRGRGLQTALLRHRCVIAARSGAELVYSQAAFGSASHRNMERIGLRVLCTRSIWTR
jgi:ribosomal protein S18 acetylase RimI-like enzyme